MATRPPLPFGLGRDPICNPERCRSPNTPLPASGNPLHDQVTQALSALFQTFFGTSLRYLGVSEVLDWVESSGTIDAWILTGLEQGRLPHELNNKRNLDFGREAIRSVVKNALEAEDEAWATSLRETGFSSSVSMVYEGIVGQLKTSKNAPLPCLHTLLTPTGLSLLQSAPLKSAFPSCPSRPPPSCSPLLSSISNLITRGALTGSHWKTPSTWRAQIRKAFAAYHTLLRELAEELVSARDFAEEYYIFLENISQPLQLLQLVAEDFEVEFGAGATRGLLGVGEAGGDNLISIMDFCAARKPSELLARVRLRVQEKQAREKRAKELESKRGQLKELDAKIRALLLEYRSTGAGTAPSRLPPPSTLEEVQVARGKEEAAEALQVRLEKALDERDSVKGQVEELQAREEEEDARRKRERQEKERALAQVGVKVEGGKLTRTQVPPVGSETPSQQEGGEEKGFVIGSSKELGFLPTLDTPVDPFAANAPRAPRGGDAAAAPSGGAKAKSKGKGKAVGVAAGDMKIRGTAPPLPTTSQRTQSRYARLRDFSPAPSPASSRSSSPVPPVLPPNSSSGLQVPRKRAPPSTSSSAASPTRTRRAPRAKGSKLRPRSKAASAVTDCCCPECCPQCTAEAAAAWSSARPDEGPAPAPPGPETEQRELSRAREMLDLTHQRRAERKERLREELVGRGLGGSGSGDEVGEKGTQVRVEVEDKVEAQPQMHEGGEEGDDDEPPPLIPYFANSSSASPTAPPVERAMSRSSSTDWMPSLQDFFTLTPTKTRSSHPEPVPEPELRSRSASIETTASLPDLEPLNFPSATTTPSTQTSSVMQRSPSQESTDSMPPLVNDAAPSGRRRTSTADSLPDPEPLPHTSSLARMERGDSISSSDSMPPLLDANEEQEAASVGISRSVSAESMPDLEELPSQVPTPKPATPKPRPRPYQSEEGADSSPSFARQKSSDSLPDLVPLESSTKDDNDDCDDPPEVALPPTDAQPPQSTTPLNETTNTSSAGNGNGTTTTKKKKKKKKKSANATATDPSLSAASPYVQQQQQQSITLSRSPPPKCCPPDRCTGVGPNYDIWAELDQLLYETCLAGFKYELIGSLPAALALVRDTLAKNYLLAGGRMTTNAGEPKEMDTWLGVAEQRGLWHSVNYPTVQAWGQRVLAISLQKLVDVLRATLGDLCICKISQHLDILREARHRLEACEQLDRQIPIDLAEMDHQKFMKWAHVQLREHKLSGHEWEGLSRQYVVQDFLLAFSDAFDAAMDRLVLRDPLLLAEDIATLLEWQGGVRTFESALRLGAREREGIIAEFGVAEGVLDGSEEGPKERRPLQAWGRLLELSSEARASGMAFSRDLAEQEKQRGNEHFAAGEFQKAIVSFTTASIIYPLEPTYCSNSAAARMKLGTTAQYSEAICDCTIALFYDPKNIKALYRRGMALALTNHWKAAFADLRYLESEWPDCQPAKEALSWAKERYAAYKRSAKAAKA
ncbi:hypothetical protein JCM11641_006992 [Rhodosporidiobolus odoratus]